MHFVNEVVDRIQQDIEINQGLSNVNFSRFFGDVLSLASILVFSVTLEMSEEEAALCEGIIADCNFGCSGGSTRPIKEHLVMLNTNLQMTAQYLQKELGVRVSFHKTGEALTVLGLAPVRNCHQFLDEIEGATETLVRGPYSQEDFKASDFFLKSIR